MHLQKRPEHPLRGIRPAIGGVARHRDAALCEYRCLLQPCRPSQRHAIQSRGKRWVPGCQRVVGHSKSRVRLTEEYKQCRGPPEACHWHCGAPRDCCSVRSAWSGGLAATRATVAASASAAKADCASWGHLRTTAACHASDALGDGPACLKQLGGSHHPGFCGI